MCLQVATLKKLKSLDLSKHNIVQWNQYFIDRGHSCLEFEHLDRSLLNFMEERKFRPLLVKEIRPIVQQVAQALKHLKAVGIIHTDLKMDNIMLVDQLRQPYRVKLIDFGLAHEVSAAVTGSYLQPRAYRSPEILLGNRFSVAIDMWSLGCTAAALYLGSVLYPGLGEYEMIKFIMETQGQLPDTMLDKGRKTRKYFRRAVNSTTSHWQLKTPDEYRRATGKQPMENRSFKFSSLDHLVDVQPINSHNSADRVAEISDVNMFVDMLKAMLQLNPNTRATPYELLEHKFISMHHIASMRKKSSYVLSCFQMMEIQTSDSSTAGGPLVQPQCTATGLVQPNPPSHAGSGKTHQPQHTSRLPCTSTQFKGTDESNIKRSLQGNCDFSSRIHDYWHTRQRRPGQRTRPAEHHQPSAGPSDRTRTEGQVQSGLRRGDHDYVPSHKDRSQRDRNVRSSTRDYHWDTRQRQPDQGTRPAEHHQPSTRPSDRTRTEGQAQWRLRRGDHDDVPSHHDRRKRDRNVRATGRDDYWHTRQRQPDQRTRPAEHHQPSTRPSVSTRTEGQAQWRLRRGDHDDVPSHHDIRKRDRDVRATGREDYLHTQQRQQDHRTKPAEHHQPSAGHLDSTRTEGQAQTGLKRKRDGPDDVLSQNDGRKRDRNDRADGRDYHWDTRQRRPDQRTRPAEHHQPSTGPSDSTRTEGQAQSGLKRKRDDHDDMLSQHDGRKRKK
ncbi:dual specificity tyrosine-phosphorylation-regulated kinase mbk-1-like [Platichthys flesus]|uniref:dual specificity tyrosine-phosphorylation-regulated kinase mbk-1-like n=1 Tax=Platichthys flesus TaxID=8260 RepID=UPI002DB7DDBD|nr:dual specificity tyrosine-phosphorylation-regulated kinase mbk-1-like [Platichthys flesus]